MVVRIRRRERTTKATGGYSSSSVNSGKNNKYTIVGYNPGYENIFIDDNYSLLPVGYGKGNTVVPFALANDSNRLINWQWEKDDESSDEIPSLGGTKKGGKTQKKGKITDDDDIPELSYANQSSITDIMKEQLRDKVKNAPELQQLDPRLADSAKMVVHYQDADAILLQSKLKLDEERTKVILRQLELLSIVGMEQADGSRSVLIKNENDLAEIMDVVFE